MTTTNKLRCLLDERDVEYETADTDTYKFTRWRNGEIDAAWDDAENWEQPHLFVIGITPAQAIAATLGTGTCQIEHYDTDILLGEDYYRCTACHSEIFYNLGYRFCPYCGAKVVN